MHAKIDGELLKANLMENFKKEITILMTFERGRDGKSLESGVEIRR